jgi:hypothetical protein
MSGWHWLIGVAAVLGLAGGLYGLHRLALWLEDRGWLFYLRKKPSTSPAGCWVAAHQFLEPGVEHVLQLKAEKRDEDGEAARERFFASLLACLDQVPFDPEEVRRHLTFAKRAGLDWQGLYEEAVRVQRSVRPDRAALLPPAATVAPPD